jgi:AmmeMemoRadiSam system protein A
MRTPAKGVAVKQDEHPLVQLARRAIEAWVRDGRVIEPPDPLTPELAEQAGAFVSLHCRGQLRGCIGTIEPSQINVAQEIIANAIAAATRDPRFPPVGPEELRGLEVKVDVLTSPEPISGPEQLDPKRYGVIVQSGWRRGLLLPDLEEVDTVEYQVDIARRKAGIGPRESAQLYRFEVRRYT